MLYNAKKLKPKSIKLNDTSKWNCNQENLQLIKLRTITRGEPYYIKYGFIPIDMETYKYNKIVFNKQILIKETAFESLINVKNYNKLYSNEEKERIINKLIPYYEKNKNKTASEFLLRLLNNKNNCSIISKIYELLYLDIGYKKYSNKEFYIKL